MLSPAPAPSPCRPATRVCTRGARDQPTRRPRLHPRGSPCLHKTGQTPQSRRARTAVEKDEQKRPIHQLIEQGRNLGSRERCVPFPRGAAPTARSRRAPHPACPARLTQENLVAKKMEPLPSAQHPADARRCNGGPAFESTGDLGSSSHPPS